MSDLSEDDYGPKVSKGEKISIKVSMPEFKVEKEGKKGSRVVYTDNDLSLKWESGDQLAIVGYNGNNCVGKSDLSLSSSNNANAVFEGNTVAGATTYDVYYPASAVDASGNVNINYSSQSQNGNGSTAHLKNVILLKQTGGRLTADEVLLKEKDIPMQMQNSIMKFELSNLYVNTPKSLTWEVKDSDENTILSQTLGIQNADVSQSRTFTGYLCFPSTSANVKNITISLPGQEAYHIDVNRQITYQPNYRYTATLHRVYYESNVDLNADADNVFTPEPKGGSWNQETKEGYLDFDETNVVFNKYENKKETWKKIEYLDIDGISKIESGAFTNNVLGWIILHEGLNTIGDGAFEKCVSLKSVKIADGITSIGSRTFAGSGLTDIAIPNSVTRIENKAFEGCSSLNQITIPASVDYLGKDVFKNCNSISQLKVMPETPPALADGDNPLGFNGWGKIHVPSSSLETYKKAKGWSEYEARILPIQ